MPSFTAGQKLRASQLSSDIISAIVQSGVTQTVGLRVASGKVNATFSALSYSLVGINYAAAGFTQIPVVIAVAEGDAATGRLVVHSGTPTTTGTTLVPCTANSSNITATIPIRWLAIGV